MKYFLIIFVTLSIFLSGCNYLDMVPEDDIETIETIFEKREQAETWFKGCHVYMQEPITSVIANPAFAGADEVVAGDFTRQFYGSTSAFRWYGLFIGDGLQMAQDPYGNVWKESEFYTAIRYCNIFFERIPNVYNMENSEKELWVAELQALKAHYYFELMRRYGPIVLVSQNIDVNEEITVMQQPRRPVDECVDSIVSLLDKAMKVLPPFAQKAQSRWGYYNLEAAATLKAQVLLYAASPLFNGNPMYANLKNKNGVPLFNPVKDLEKWKIAAIAADEALEICLANGKHLIQGSTSKNSDLLNVMQDIENSVLAPNFKNEEAIFMFRPPYQQIHFWYNWTLPYFKSTDTDFSSDTKGCVAPSMKMVEMYYTERGLPIDADKEWSYTSRYQMSKENKPQYQNVVPLQTDVLGLHLGREPRFYANIAADRCIWERGKSKFRQVLAYQGEAWGSQYTSITNAPQNLTGYWMKKGSYSDVSNKEYKNVVDTREEAAIVTRLAELYLMKAEAWNEYEGPLVNRSHVYEPLNEVRRRAGIPDVETSWGSYSKTPEKVKNKDGMQEIIRREWSIEFAFEGKRFWNLRRWLIAEEELNTKLYGWNVLGKNAEQFYNNYNGPVVVWAKRRFTVPRDYLFPIQSEEVMVSGCVQNPGW